MKDVGHRMIHSESKIYENLRYDSSSKECSQGQVFCVFQKPILTEKGLIENVSERSGKFLTYPNNFSVQSKEEYMFMFDTSFLNLTQSLTKLSIHELSRLAFKCRLRI